MTASGETTATAQSWRRALIVAALLALAGLAAYGLRQVCVPITDAELANFNVPIERRTDRDLYMRVFQRRGERWYQCKTWLSRQFFF